MRHALLAGLVTGVLMVTMVGAAAAQDDEEPQVILAPPGYELERVEIAAADLAMLLPVDWDVDVRMQEGESRLPPDHADQAAVASLEIVYAEDDMGDWCSLSSYADTPLSPEEQAQWDASRMEAASQGDFSASDSIWVIGDELGHMMELTATSGFGAVQEFVWDLAGTRYALLCSSPYAANRSWQAMADSVAPMEADVPDDPAVSPAVEDTAVEPAVEPPSIEVVGGLQRVAVPQAGIAVSLPADWDVDVQMEPRELGLPPGYEDEPPATEWSVLYAPMPDASGWCSLVMVTDMPVPFETWAVGYVPDPDAGGRPVSVDSVELPVGEAIRVHDEYVEDELIFATLYLFESAGSYYWLGCAQASPAEDYWLSIAETLEPLGDEADGMTGLQRVDVPEAGIAISVPADWTVELEMTEDELVSADAEGTPISYLNVLYAEDPGGGWCQLQRYEWLVDDLSAFADTVAGNYLAQSSDDATADVSMTQLEIGEAARVEAFDPLDARSTLIYAVASETALFQVACMGGEADVPVMDRIARSLTWPAADGGPAHGPAPGADLEVASADAVTGFASEVEVADGMLMSADCELAAWVAFGDGTFREWIDCTLSDAPVAQPEWQGARPEELLTVAGGECEWTSDYWAVTDGSEVWADSYELTITPEGRVFGSSFYAPDMLECGD